MRRLASLVAILCSLSGCTLDSSALAPRPVDGSVLDSRTGRGDSGAPGDGGPADAPDSRVTADSTVTPRDAGVDTAPPAWLADRGRRKRIVVPAGAVAGPLDGYVVAVQLEADGDLVGHAGPDGEDIAFTAIDGTSVLPFEVEGYRPGDGSLMAWVRLPRVEAATDTAFYLYYDEPGATSFADPRATWEGVAGVWHLAAGPGRTEFEDSTRGDNDGAARGGRQSPMDARGIAGRARGFDGHDDSVGLGDPPDGSLDFGSASFSFSLWTRVERAVGSWDMPWHKGGACAGCRGYDMELGTSTWRAHLSDGSMIRGADFGPEGEFNGRWVHLVAVVDRAAPALILYADGAERSRVDITGIGSVDTDNVASIGYEGYPLLGRIDEVRVYRRALGPTEVAADHALTGGPSVLRIEGEELP